MKEEKEKKTKKRTKKTEEEKKTTKRSKKEETVKEEKPKRTRKTKTEVTEEKTSKVVKAKEEVLLEKKSQKELRVISKVAYILAKIGRVCLMIAIPFIFLSMIIVPFVLNKVNVDGNIIRIDDASFILNEDNVIAKIGNNTYISEENLNVYGDIFNFLNKNELTRLLWFIELALGFVAISVIIAIYQLINVEKLFKSFHKEKVPFTKENCNHVRNICNLLVASAILSIVAEIVLSLIMPSFNINIASFSIMQLLVMFIIYYLFRYATEMQKKSNTVMYD